MLRQVIAHGLGTLGAFALAVCPVPQVLQVLEQGHADGLSWGFLLLWLGGELALGSGMLAAGVRYWQVYMNYAFNIGCLVIIICYKLS